MRRGTTAVFVDPHEIANVAGKEGIALFLRHAETAPLDIFIGVPSCVPATSFEDTGAALTLAEIEVLLPHPRVYGLAEMMNFPGIIYDVGEARAKVESAYNLGKVVDGHAPGVSGNDLALYVTNGKDDGTVRIMSDHESRTGEEALEKRQAGMTVAIRYGSATKDLDQNSALPGAAEGYVWKASCSAATISMRRNFTSTATWTALYAAHGKSW